MASTYLTRTPGTGQTSRTKGTLSVWLKRAKTDEEDFIFYGFEGSANRMKITFLPSGKLQINTIQAGSNHLVYETNRLFRDTSAWYHIVIAIDTTLATAGDRCRLYVNGVEETSFSTETHFSQNDLHFFTENNIPIYIGSQATSNYYDGCMSHYHLIDGTQYQASDFGEYDANGVWKIKTSPSVTYGTHGFFILKDGNSVTDQSGNSNNFTVGGGTLTKTEDNPSSVFATLNNLDGYVSHMVFSHGNNTVDNGSTASNKSYARSTLGMSSGKFYFEAKDVTNANFQTIGITDKASGGVSGELGGSSADYVYRNDAGQKGNNNSFSSYGNSYTTNDIIGCAVDLDNLKIYFSKNGVWQNSGDPTSGATGTGAAFTITAPSLTSTGFYFFGVGDSTAANSSKWSANFGNGYFGTTAVASAGTNASGIGIFEYDVPTGYTALSTKGLNL